MKKCTKCQQEKEFSFYWKDKTRKDGYQSMCKPCWMTRPYYKKKEYLKSNERYRHTEGGIDFRKRNQKKYNATSYKKRPEVYKAGTALRRATLAKATPKWLTKEMKKEISNLYKKAKELNLSVDHIYPINGKTCTGLHVPWNLQLLTLSENCSKKNRIPEGIPLKP